MEKDRIEKQIQLKAARARVWRALTDYREFGVWFNVKLEGPFLPGKPCRGSITYCGYEYLRMEVIVQEMEPEHFFSYTWHPYAIEQDVDYSEEIPTLVEFRLKDNSGGTLLTMTESGFSRLPESRRAIAFRKNDEGWSAQLQNIESYLQ